MKKMSRREFAAATALSFGGVSRLRGAVQSFRVGHATTTHLHYKKETASFWKGVEDLSSLGFRGTEADDMIAHLSDVYRDKTGEFRQRMTKHNMTLPALYHTLPEDFLARDRKALMAHLMQVGKFIKDVGGAIFNLSGPDPVPKGDRREQIRGICRVGNELGPRLRDELGLRVGYHPESESVFEGRDDISLLMDGAKPDVFHLDPDVGHLTALGCDPLEVLKTYRSRLLHMHAKDYDPRQKRFVRLGQGVVQFPAIVEFLNSANYTGWFMIELDPPVTTPLEDSKANHTYVTRTLKLSLA